MQKWEYKMVSRSRDFDLKVYGDRIGDWDKSIKDLLPAWGMEGWELVAVVPRSDFAGDKWAGATSSELWIFKRPFQGS